MSEEASRAAVSLRLVPDAEDISDPPEGAGAPAGSRNAPSANGDRPPLQQEHRAGVERELDVVVPRTIDGVASLREGVQRGELRVVQAGRVHVRSVDGSLAWTGRVGSKCHVLLSR